MKDMDILQDKITKVELQERAQRIFGNMIKAVIDVEKEIIAIDAEMHADEEKLLLENGSRQKDLWGINLYPEFDNEDFVEFDSMINLRPSQNNRTRSVEDENIQKKIREIVSKYVE